MDLRKVAIIGCGMVGSATAFSLMQSGLFTDMLLIDVNRQKAEGEAMDLSHCLPFTDPIEIRAGDYCDLDDYGMIVITAGVAQKPGETRHDCIENNVKVMRSVMSGINRYNRDGYILVVSNPVDALSYACYALSGRAPHRVFGSGTVLDSARLKFAVSKKLNVDPRSVHAFVIGEHGDSEFALWRGANVGGIPLDAYCAHCGSNCEYDRNELETDVKNSAYEIIARKGATYYGIAATVRRICESVVRDQHSILPVSTYVRGHYGLDDIYISVPALVGSGGIEDIVDIPLSDEEQSRLNKSASVLKDLISQLNM